mgnify:CR=1 FL=1
MGKNTRRYVMTFSRDMTIGWPEDILFRDAPDETFVMTRFHVNAPEAGFCEISRFGQEEIEFCHEDWPMIALAVLPGRPIDPFAWMGRGSLRAKTTPTTFKDSALFRLQARYTGRIPQGMRAGDSYRLTFMLIGREEDMRCQPEF